MLAARTSLFDKLPSSFFRPLTGRSARLYETLLRRCYESEVEEQYAFLKRAFVVELAEGIVRLEQEWYERPFLDELLDEEGEEARREIESAEGEALRSVAQRMVGRLEKCGWFSTEYVRDVGEVVAFHPDASRILALLVRLGRDDPTPLQGYAHQLWQGLSAESFNDKPGIALLTARDNAKEFVRELKNLDRNIVIAVRDLQREAEQAHEVLEDAFERYERRIAALYDRLKRHENFYRLRDDIEARLDAISEQTIQLGLAARWRAEHDGVDEAEGLRRVNVDLGMMRRLLSAIPPTLDSIDARNTRYSGVARRKIMYLLHQERSLEGQLADVVQRSIRLLNDPTSPIPEWDLHKVRFIDDEALATLPTRRSRPLSVPIAERSRTADADVDRAVEALVLGAFSERAMREEARRLLSGRSRIPVAEVALSTSDTFLRMVFLQVYGLRKNSHYRFDYSTCDGFRRCSSATCLRCRAESELYRIPNGSLVQARFLEPTDGPGEL